MLGLPFTLVYPQRRMKDIYLDQYKMRGSSHSFVEMLRMNWDEFITQMSDQRNCLHIVLDKGEYVSDYVIRDYYTDGSGK